MADTNPRERIKNEISAPPTRRAVGPINALDLEAALLGLPGNIKLPGPANDQKISSNSGKVTPRYIPPAFYLVNQLMQSEPSIESSEPRGKIKPPPPLKPI